MPHPQADIPLPPSASAVHAAPAASALSAESPIRGFFHSKNELVLIGWSLGAALLLFFGLVLTHRYMPIIGFDEGILLVYPEQILRGRIPNLDFFSVYPPGNFWIIAIAYKIFGISITTERFVGIIYRMILVVGIYACTVRRGHIIAAGCAMLTAIASTYSGILAFAWIGAMALAISSLFLLSLALRTSGSKQYVSLIIAGLLAGFTPAMRIDMPGVAVLLASLPLLVLIRSWKLRSFYIGGWIIGILPLMWHVLRIGIGQFIESVFIEPISRIGPARRVPFPPSDPDITLLLIVTIACVLLVVGAAAFQLKRKRDRDTWTFAALGIFTLCLLPQAVQRLDLVHCMYVAEISWGLAPIALAILLEDRLKLPPRNRLVQVIATSLVFNLLLFGGHAALPDFSRLVPVHTPDPDSIEAHFVTNVSATRRHYWITNQGRTIPVANQAEEVFYGSVLNYVSSITRPGDKVFVGTTDLRYTGLNDVYFYFLLPQLVPAGYYLEFNPESANRPDSPLPRDIASAKVLILNSMHSNPSPNRGAAGSNAANEVVQSKFVAEGTADVLTVYVRKPD